MRRNSGYKKTGTLGFGFLTAAVAEIFEFAVCVAVVLKPEGTHYFPALAFLCYNSSFLGKRHTATDLVCNTVPDGGAVHKE